MPRWEESTAAPRPSRPDVWRARSNFMASRFRSSSRTDGRIMSPPPATAAMALDQRLFFEVAPTPRARTSCGTEARSGVSSRTSRIQVRHLCRRDQHRHPRAWPADHAPHGMMGPARWRRWRKRQLCAGRGSRSTSARRTSRRRERAPGARALSSQRSAGDMFEWCAGGTSTRRPSPRSAPPPNVCATRVIDSVGAGGDDSLTKPRSRTLYLTGSPRRRRRPRTTCALAVHVGNRSRIPPARPRSRPGASGSGAVSR